LSSFSSPLTSPILSRDHGSYIESAKDEIFECTNPGIGQYLRKQEITDPEAHIRYFIEKANRGEVEDLFAGTLLGDMLGNTT
jgi:hypothetical protein